MAFLALFGIGATAIHTDNQSLTTSTSSISITKSESSSTTSATPNKNNEVVAKVQTNTSVPTKIDPITKYPFSIYPIVPNTQIEILVQSFNTKNPICDPVNTDSFDTTGTLKSVSCPILDYSGRSYNTPVTNADMDNMQAYYAGMKVSETFTNADIIKVTQFISENSNFFGIDDIDNFHLTPATDGNLYYEANQNISGYYLDETSKGGFPQQIIIQKQGKTVTIIGHFYPHASLPTKPALSLQDIDNLFIGKDYSYPAYICIDNFNKTCHPNMLTVKLGANNLQINLVAFLSDADKTGTELRLAYIIHITLPYQSGSAQNYTNTETIDAMTGQQL